jgi:peptide/nickel transport system permease protein
MGAYLVRRGLQMMVVLLLSSMAIYTILNLAPGGPLAGVKMAGAGSQKDRLSEAEIEKMKELLGLDKPPYIRYIAWMVGDDWMGALNEEWAGTRRGILRGDLGESWKKHRAVSAMIKERLPNTILLMTTAALLSMLVAIPAGVISAVRQYSRVDYTFTLFTFFGIAIPAFWFGLMLIILTGYLFKQWGLPALPTGGTMSLRPPQPGTLLYLLNVKPGSITDRAVYLILPTIVLSLLSMAAWGRYVRSSMLEVLRQDYVRTARAKGLTERLVISRHAMRNALIPLVTIITFEIPIIFGGAVLTETIFAYPGMGRLYIESLGQQDWPVLQSFLIISAVLVVFATLLTDILYTVVDPRIRF